MNSLPQSLLRALPRPSSTAGVAAAPQLAFIRHQSSSRRLTKRLQLPPHESFKLTASSPAKSHIVYNPPSTSPSVYATPTLFLPRDDPRRTLFAQTRPTAAEKQQAARLPPPLKRPHEKKYHLTPENFAEIRALRDSDPDTWTRSKLAAKFGTSQFFIGMVCEASVQRKEEMQGRLATIKRQWGKRKATARLDRKRRKAGWGGADEQ